MAETAPATELPVGTLVVQPAPPSPEGQADMLELAGLFFVTALVIFLARRLVDLFRVDPD